MRNFQNQNLTPTKKRNEKQKLKIAVVDIETKNWTTILAVGIYDGEKDYYFKTIENFLDFVLSRKYRGYRIYAHNGGKFDFLPIVEILSLRQIPYTITQIAGRAAQIKVHIGNHIIYFRDSICILPASLKKLSDAFKPEYPKLDFDFENNVFNLENAIHRKYLKNDLLCTFEILTRFFDTEKVRDVTPKLTVASTALAIHRTTLKAPIRKSPQEIQNFVRSGYFGGRVEIFKHEGYNLNYFDYNSIYPFIMKTCPIPVEYLGEADDIDDFGFHKVTIEIPDGIKIPPLPHKYTTNKGSKLIFPTGELTGVFFSEEIKLAISIGCKLKKYHYGEQFSKEFDFFSEYIDYFYSLRLANKGNALDFVAKLFLNSLYGKYGQKESFTTLQTMSLDKENDGEIFGNEEIFNKFGLIVKEIKKRSPHMLVHIANAITSQSRVHLYRSGIYPNMDSIRYCDTDSLFLPETLQTSKELGALKLEDSFDYAYFRLPKTYATIGGKKPENFGTHFKCKGFPEEFLTNLSLEQFKTDSLQASRLKVMGLKSALKRFNTSFIACEMSKSIISTYDKRKTLECGIETRAWHLTNEGKLR